MGAEGSKSPLLWYASNNSYEGVRRRVAARQLRDLNQTSQAGWTPIMYAISNKNARMVKLLLDCKANLEIQNANGYTALHVAVKVGDFEIVQMLLRAGANPNKPSRNGNTPISKAVKYQYGDIVKALLLRGADITIRNSKGELPMDKARTPYMISLLKQSKYLRPTGSRREVRGNKNHIYFEYDL